MFPWHRKGVVSLNISDISTKALVEELSKRAGVEKKIAEPYQDISLEVNGPAIVLIVID